MICTARDRAWLEAQGARDRGALAKLIFSAKECAYKCQYGLTRTLLDFDAFDVLPDPDNARFVATLTRDVGPLGQGMTFEGRALIAGDLIVTLMVLRY
jgi:4'-phosphopantetheinyl transferase EntD